MIVENGLTFTSELFQDPFYATGFPVTEAYWASVKVGAIATDVLIQCFERRCLTYTPSNPAGWQVEAGNVGQHYYAWRYGQDPPANPTPPSQPQPPPSTGQLPEIITDYFWANPEAAVLKALDEVGLATSGPIADAMRESAWAFHGQYHLATAPLGYWNHDTRGFYDWLYERIRTGPCTYNEHLNDQVRAMIYDPESNISRRLRDLEVRYEANGYGSGSDVYLVYMHLALIPPYCLTPMSERALAGVWYKMEQDYAVQRYSTSSDPGFAAFLASRGYDPPWGYD